MGTNPFVVKNEKGSIDKDRQFVGAFVPRHLAEKISLWSLFFGTTKTQVIIDLIKNTEKKQPNFLQEITKALSSRIYANWEIIFKMNLGKKHWQTDYQINRKFNNYANEIKKSLYKKNICKKTSDLIISQMKGLYGKNKKENIGGTNQDPCKQKDSNKA